MIALLIVSLENTRRQNRIDRQHCPLIQLWRLCQNLYFARLHCQAVFNLPHCSSADSLVDPQLRASTSTGSSCALGEQEDDEDAFQFFSITNRHPNHPTQSKPVPSKTIFFISTTHYRSHDRSPHC